MPTPKNGFQILNLHLKKHVFKKKNIIFFNVLLPKYYLRIFRTALVFELYKEKEHKNRHNKTQVLK